MRSTCLAIVRYCWLGLGTYNEKPLATDQRHQSVTRVMYLEIKVMHRPWPYVLFFGILKYVCDIVKKFTFVSHLLMSSCLT